MIPRPALSSAAAWQTVAGRRMTVIGADELLCPPCYRARRTELGALSLRELDAARGEGNQ